MRAKMKISERIVVEKMIEFDVTCPCENLLHIAYNPEQDKEFEKNGFVCMGWAKDPPHGEVHIWVDIDRN